MCIDIKPGWNWRKLAIISLAVNCWIREPTQQCLIECYHVACGRCVFALVQLWLLKEIFFVSFLSYSYSNIKHDRRLWSQRIIVRTMTRDDGKMYKTGKENVVKRNDKNERIWRKKNWSQNSSQEAKSFMIGIKHFNMLRWYDHWNEMENMLFSVAELLIRYLDRYW